MSDSFYVVSRGNSTPDGEYETAVVFNSTSKDADNEGAANAYLAERNSVAPWQTHEVLSGDDFAGKYPEKTDDVTAPGDATDDDDEH